MNGLSDVRLTLHSQELAAGQEKGLRSAMLRNPPVRPEPLGPVLASSAYTPSLVGTYTRTVA